MTITYWTNFSKRINSTKQPTGGTNITTVALKTPCSIETPVFILNGISDSINYIKWGSRYYYVTDVTWLTNNNIQVSCDLDVLATYKSNILATKAFVEYSQTSYDMDILDPRISTNGKTYVTQYTSNLIDSMSSAGGVFIITTVSDDGAANYYAITRANLNALGAYISTTITDTMADAFIKKFGSVMGCILNCTWVPFNYPYSGDTLKLGAIDTGISCYKIPLPAEIKAAGTFTFGWHFTEKGRIDMEHLSIYLPGYGNVDIQPASIGYATSIGVSIYGDVTGGLTYTLQASGCDKMIFNCNVGVQVPITQFTQAPIGMLAGKVSSNFEFASQWNLSNYSGDGINNAIGRAVGKFDGFISRITGRQKNMGAVASSIGGQGGASVAYELIYNPTIYIVVRSYQYTETQANMVDRYGGPLFAVRTLSSFSGYVKTNGASVDIPGYEEEKDKVCAMLNSGIFIE